MSTLKDALKSTSTSSKNPSSKTPTFYNREKVLFIEGMAHNPDEIVRIAVAGNAHVPANVLKQMIATETDSDVLRIVLMNPRTPWKAITEFITDARADVFDEDEEVIEYLKSRRAASE